MKALIIEDEAVLAENLQQLLREIAPHIDVQAVLPSVKSGRRWFIQHDEPDVLFMDIQLSDGLSFELFQYFDIRCPVIFTTAYDEYAIKAFKYNGIDYLLKPFDEEELLPALEKLKAVHTPARLPVEWMQVMSQQQAMPVKHYKEKLVAQQRNSSVLIDTADIALIYRDEIIFILLSDGQKLVAEQATLDELEDLLDPNLFCRVNRAQIIHINSVGSYRQDGTGKLYLTLKLKNQALPPVEISRNKAHVFRRWINR